MDVKEVRGRNSGMREEEYVEKKKKVKRRGRNWAGELGVLEQWKRWGRCHCHSLVTLTRSILAPKPSPSSNNN